MPIVTLKSQDEIRALVLNALRAHPYRPIELIQELQTAEITESALKDALAELIDGSIIELSPDRHITLRSSHPAEPLAAPR
jgi:hypothetical protein